MIFLLLMTIIICKYIDIGKTYEDKLLAKEIDVRGHSYYFELKYLKENADVLIILSQLTPQGDPNIFVSKENESPFSIEESELAFCQSLGYGKSKYKQDLCVLDKSQLEINTKYYIGIICKGDCYYSLKVDYDFEQYLEMNDIIQLKMSEAQQSNIIKIKLKTIENMKELQIFGHVVNFHELENPFYMYLNLGDTIPSSQNHDFQGETSQNGNQIISIPLKALEGLQLLTQVVEAQIGSFIEIRTIATSNKTKHLSQNLINSYVREDQIHLFEIQNIQKLIDSQYFLQLQIEIIFGEILMGIQIDKQQPSQIKDYQYAFQTNQSMRYQLPHYQIDYINDENYITIAVKGIKSTSFQFCVFQSTQDSGNFISKNVLYRSVIVGESVNNYFIPAFPQQMYNNYTIKFHTESDNLILVLRSIIARQNFTQKDYQQIEKFYSNDPNNLFIYTKQKQTQIELEISKKESVIYYYCISILQIPDNVQMQSFGYSLYLESQFQSQNLLMNTPHKTFGYQNQYSYFNFNLNFTQKINKMLIMINAIQGKFLIFSSKTKFPDAVEFEKRGIDNIIEYDFKNTIQKEQNFYISVLSEIAGFYTITVVLKIDSLNANTYGDFPWEYAQIYQGNPQKYILNSNKSVELLKIDFSQSQRQVQIKNKSAEFARIHLDSKVGSLYIYGFTSPSSIIANAIWGGESQINLSTSDFHDDMIVYLRIELQKNYNQSSFKIAYTLKRSDLFDISENENYFGCLDFVHYSSFMFKYFQVKNYVMIIKNEATEEKLRTMIAFNTTEFSTNDSITFINEQLLRDQNCLQDNQKEEMCFLLLSIKSIQFTFFSLSIKEAPPQQHLALGQTKYLETPTFQNYFYSVINNIGFEIIVTTLTQNQQLQILATFYNKTNNLGLHEYPQNGSSDNFNNILVVDKYLNQIQVSLHIQEIQQRNCSESCIVAITIQPLEENNQENSFNLYSILMQPEVKILYEGKESSAQIANEQFQYYQFTTNVAQMEIKIKLSGCIEAIIFVSKNEVPSFENFDWFTDSNEIIIKNKKEKHFDMSGKYFIGILGQTDECTYKIQYELIELKNNTQVIQQQINAFQPNFLINNQKEFIANQDPIIWQTNCSHGSQIIIQLLFSSDIKVEGGFSFQNLLASKNLSKFTTLKKTKQQIFGYFHPKQEGVFYIKTQSNQNYSLRATQISSTLTNFIFELFFPIFDSFGVSQIETSVDHIQLIQKNFSYQIQEIQFKIFEIIEDQNLNPAISNQLPLSQIILRKNEPLQQIRFPNSSGQISLNNLTYYLMLNEILITLSSKDVLIIDTLNYYNLTLNNEVLVQGTGSYSMFSIVIMAIMMLVIIYITFKKKKIPSKENQSLVKMVEMHLKVKEEK